MGLIAADSKVRMAGVGKGSCNWMFQGEGFNFYKTGCGKGYITMEGSIKDKKYKVPNLNFWKKEIRLGTF